MYIKNTIILLLFLITTALSCQPTQSKTDTQSTLKGNFLIQYIESETLVKATARFQNIGNELNDKKSIELEEVKFQGLLMKYNGMLTEYRVTNIKIFESAYNIDFKTTDGQKGIQTFNMSGLSSFSVKNNIILKNEGFTLNWEGDKLGPDEEMLIFVEVESAKPLTLGLLGPTTANKFIIQKEQLEQLPLGKGKISLVRKKNFVLKGNGLAEGGGIVEYYTKPINIDVK